ncbi:transposase, is4 family [Heliomicrobium modesticaldum Ice1]|uniref:Transposase, is4 family n=1 Tax=Heliobacterium modesticaldum (strain ATCC 51547 / Ice1) TaxID=498761 RepID=B0THI9_HELMI|nr:IS1380-like element ISHmo1 family transposase [Heliomicrobium modesticaldum]ABZ83427.1 transposase, is4 family [Heliomicrobium modesticaldum Ice1]
MTMKKFIIEQSNEELTPVTGLALVGALLRKTSLKLRLDKSTVPTCLTPDISHGTVALSYLGLLCQGKNDFDAIELARGDDFFRYAMGVDIVPSSPTLRQRFEKVVETDLKWNDIIMEESARLIKKAKAPLTPVRVGATDYLTVDVDVTPLDNSGSKKEGVTRTYKGNDGFAPILAYLGQEGYCINVELRPGKDHSQKGTPQFLTKSINYARQCGAEKLLVRMDSGFDSVDNIRVLRAENVDYIIKRNLRQETPEMWRDIALKNGQARIVREGKVEYMGSVMWKVGNMEQRERVVFHVVERTILSNGQQLLLPELEVATYWTSLPVSPEELIHLQRDHGTSEQFHSELKTDLDLERLPSGKFKVNDLVFHFGALAYNLLRIVGQMSLHHPDSPLKRKAHTQRRRIRTVLQNVITIASRLVRHARQVKLRLGAHSPWYATFKDLYLAFS